MTCRKAQQWMQHALDIPLSPAQRAGLDAHLEGCAACRKTFDDYRRLSRTADLWVRRPGPDDLPPDTFTAQVMSRVAEHKEARQRTAFAFPVAVLAATVLLVALSCAAAPFLPPLPSWKPLADMVAFPRDLWTEAQALLPLRWAILLLPPALAANALLAWGGRRRA